MSEDISVLQGELVRLDQKLLFSFSGTVITKFA
jgi:hypothetical protein